MNSSQPTYVVGLMGGLGNNLHQIALGKYLEEKGFRVKFDITLISPNATVFEIPSLRDFVLDRKKLLWNFLPSPLGRFRFIAIQIRRLIGPMRVVTSLKANDSIDIKDSKGSWLYGYWQRLDYSESIMEELKDFFLPSYQIGDSIRKTPH